MDETTEPTSSPDDGTASLDAEGNCISNYGTFQGQQEDNKDEDTAPHNVPFHTEKTNEERTNGENFSNDESKQLQVHADANKTRQKYRKRGDSGAALLKATSRSTPQDTNNSCKDAIRDSSGDENMKHTDEEDVERTDSESTRLADEANATMETVISEEEYERDPSTVSATSDETVDVDAQPRTPRSLKVTTNMDSQNETNALKAADEIKKVVVPPEQLVLERLQKEKEDAGHLTICDESDSDTQRLRSNSKNVRFYNNQSISRPMNLRRDMSLLSDINSDTHSTLDWEWIDEADQAGADDICSKYICMMSKTLYIQWLKLGGGGGNPQDNRACTSKFCQNWSLVNKTSIKMKHLR